jgi:hypothetical protein
MAMIIAELYGYTGVLIVCISYLLLMKLIYNIQITLASYSIKVSRRLGFILFGWFQIALIFFLIRRGVFATLGQIFRYIYGGDLDLPSGLLYLLFECLRNKVVIALIIISVIGIMNLFRTNLEHEVLARKQGVDLPLEDGGTRHVDAKQKRYPIFFACLFVVVAPFTMSGILSKGMSLRSIFFYLLIVSAWFQISKSFTGDALEIMYGKRLRWVKSAFFCSYMFLTLALVSNYELGSVFLILSQSCPLWLFISRRTQNFIREYSI